jgi:hypothetical protein
MFEKRFQTEQNIFSLLISEPVNARRNLILKGTKT